MLASGSLELIDRTLCPAPIPIGDQRDQRYKRKGGSVRVQGPAQQGKQQQDNSAPGG
jgi:hypothetical protein